MGSAWGDFTRQDDTPARSTSEGPRGLVPGGIAVLGVGLVVTLTGFVLTYSDLRGPNDARGDNHVAFLWVPGVVIAVTGVALLVWGWWRSSHAD